MSASRLSSYSFLRFSPAPAITTAFKSGVNFSTSPAQLYTSDAGHTISARFRFASKNASI